MSAEIPRDAGEFAPGAQIAGYRLEEQIGSGGMAVVYRAHDLRLERRVALKILAPGLARDQAFRQRFLEESRAAAAVDHPNIITIFEAGEAHGVLFIAMRYVQGGDLRTLIDRAGTLSAVRVARIVAQLASALEAAHARGLVHRDVKPTNVLLDEAAGSDQRDHVYLSDFGLSKQSLAAADLTSAGQFLGTVDYVAPEQIEGRPVDGRADLYALACATFEMLCGAPPFDRDQGLAVLWAQLSDPPPALTARRPDLPPAVDEVFVKALAKSPSDRYATCHDFAAALRAACGPGRGETAASVPRAWPAAVDLAAAGGRPGTPATGADMAAGSRSAAGGEGTRAGAHPGTDVAFPAPVADRDAARDHPGTHPVSPAGTGGPIVDLAAATGAGRDAAGPATETAATGTRAGSGADTTAGKSAAAEPSQPDARPHRGPVTDSGNPSRQPGPPPLPFPAEFEATGRRPRAPHAHTQSRRVRAGGGRYGWPLFASGLAIVVAAAVGVGYLMFFHSGRVIRNAASAGTASQHPRHPTPSARVTRGTITPGGAQFPALAGVGCAGGAGTSAVTGTRSQAGDGWEHVDGGLPACGGQAIATRKTGTLGLEQDTFTWTFQVGQPATCTVQIFIADTNPSSGSAQYDVYSGSLVPGAWMGQFEINQAAAKGLWVQEGGWRVQGTLSVQLTDAPAYQGDTYHVTASAAKANCS